MKKIFLLILALIIFGSFFAQENIQVKLKEKKFYTNEATAFVVEIPEAEYKTIIKAWAKYLKGNLKEKVIIENGEVSINNKFIPKIANDSIDINSYIKEYDGHIVLAVSFKLKGKYISEDSDEEVFYPTKNYVRNFAVNQYRKAVKEVLKTENDKFLKLDSDLKMLIQENDGLIEIIKQSEREIINSKDLIALNEMDMSSKVLQIQTQKEVVYKLINTPGDEQKEAKKVLKHIESDFKKLQKKNKSLYNKIVTLETKIRETRRKIEYNEKEQKFIKLDKEDQEYIVRKIEKKINRIK